MSFTQAELVQFSRLLDGLRERDYHYSFLDDQYTLIKNKFAHMGICLTREDVNILSSMIEEAKAMFEVFEIIYK